MNTIKLNTTDRSEDDTRITGIVYGPDLEKNLNIEADYNELVKVMREAGYNKIVTINSGGEDHEVLFKDVQYNPVSNNVVHFDMYAIKRGQKMRANIPVVIIGESPAVIKGAVLNQFVDEIEVECIPSKLPESFEIDVSKLEEVGDAISTDIIPIDEDIELLGEENLTIVKVEEVREMKVEDDGPIDGPSEDDEDAADVDGGSADSGESDDEEKSEEASE